MLDQVKKTISTYEMISPGEAVVVAISGGADSVALLRALLAVRGDMGEIFAVHVNHGLRAAADSDEAFVRAFCEENGVRVKVFHADVRTHATREKMGIEEASRVLRYEIFERARAEFGACRIAVGHNADDNAETILMNLCRGAGLSGLCGIPAVNGHVIRPLIEIPRTDIEKYLSEEKIEFLTDESNFSDEFTRNRVRNNILPAISREINANAKKNITKTAQLLQADENFLENEALKAYTQIAENPTENPATITLDAKKLSLLHPAIASRTIRHAIKNSRRNLENITADHISAVQKLCTAHSGREIHLPGVTVAKEYDRLHFSSSRRGTCPVGVRLSQSDPEGQIPLWDDGASHALKGQIPERGETSANPCTKPFAYDKITLPLTLRTRKAGDKIAFKDAGGKIFTKKLQDYFTDEKIPKSERDSILLLAHGDEILWILDKKNRTNANFEPCENEKTIQVTVNGGEIQCTTT